MESQGREWPIQLHGNGSFPYHMPQKTQLLSLHTDLGIPRSSSDLFALIPTKKQNPFALAELPSFFLFQQVTQQSQAWLGATKIFAPRVERGRRRECVRLLQRPWSISSLTQGPLRCFRGQTLIRIQAVVVHGQFGSLTVFDPVCQSQSCCPVLGYLSEKLQETWVSFRVSPLRFRKQILH